MHRSPSKQTQEEKFYVKPRQPSHKNDASDKQPMPLYHNKKIFDSENVHKNKERCQKCGDSLHVESFQCPVKKYQCKTCQVSSNPRKPKAHTLQVGAVYACDRSICSHPEGLSSSDDSFCLQVKIQHSQADCNKIPTPSHLITNLTYRLKPHHTRNQYLRGRLDTCADVNDMPASVYKLVFNDSDLKSLFLVPWRLELSPQIL